MVQAGLLKLRAAVSAGGFYLLGAAVLATLFSWRPGSVLYAGITIGFVMRLTMPRPWLRALGDVLMGWGLIHFSIQVLTGGVTAHPAFFYDVMAPFMGASWWSGLAAVGLGALVGTAALSMTGGAILFFALLWGGVLETAADVLPFLLGANLAAGLVALRQGMAMNADARRTACYLLVWPMLLALLGIVLRPVLGRVMELSDSSAFWAAHSNVVLLTLAALVSLLLAPVTTKLLRHCFRQKESTPASICCLRYRYLNRPERALRAAIAELHRMASLCDRNLFYAGEILLGRGVDHKAHLMENEEVINQINNVMKEYLTALSQRSLSRRQSILIQHVERCMRDIERIDDHITRMAEISEERLQIPKAIVPEAIFRQLFELFEQMGRVLHVVTQSLDPAAQAHQAMAMAIIDVRDNYMELSARARSEFAEQLKQKNITPIGAMYLNEFITIFDRLVKHARSIALAEQQPQFWIKRKKLDRPVEEVARPEDPQPVDPAAYLGVLEPYEY
jgi:phosphate:Na+ symporter